MRIPSYLPRYSVLALCIRAVLYGAAHPLVQHMLERNRGIDLYRAANEAGA